jgi:hypothetical protein
VLRLASKNAGVGGKRTKSRKKAKVVRRYKVGNIILSVVFLVVALFTIRHVDNLGRLAEKRVEVVMFTRNIQRGEVIQPSMIQPYEMLLAEFESYSFTDPQGNLNRRILTWEDRAALGGTFASQTLQGNTVAMFPNFTRQVISYVDRAMYAFPGRYLVMMQLAPQDIAPFSIFLHPGDRLTVHGTYTSTVSEIIDDPFQGEMTVEVPVVRTDAVFGDIAIADMLNEDGESVLNILEHYRNAAANVQMSLRNTPAWVESTRPVNVLIAVTPEELDRYYYFLAQKDITFRIAIPQRVAF